MTGGHASTGLTRRTLLVAAAGAASAGAAATALAGPAFASTATAGKHPGSDPDGGFFTESTVWASGEDGVAEHFVYGFTVTPRGTALAFSEARVEAADAGAHNLVGRRSTDGGITWGPTITIEATDGVECWANPAALVDSGTGRAFIFYVLNSPDNSTTHLYYRTSDDDGATWSDRTELTDLFAGNPYGWTFHMPGPGHGLQLADGRLILQVWHRRAVSVPAAQRAYGVSVIVSDDHGRTWRAGGTVPVDAAYPVNESRLIERADGSLLMNGRYSSGGVQPRIESVSRDRGETWSHPVYDSAVPPYTAVDSSLTRYSDADRGHDVSRVLFSRPDSTVSRSNLVVSLSYDDGASFPYSRAVYPGPASYSDITRLADGTILVLYGKDLTASSTVDHVAVARFDLAWLTGGQDTPGGGPALRQYVTQAEHAKATAGQGRPVATVDASASGYAYLAYQTAAANDFVELSLVVSHAGTYDVFARMRRTASGSAVRAAIDGTAAGDAFSTAFAGAVGYAEFSCGRHTFGRPGRHTIRFTATSAAGTTIDVDYVRSQTPTA